MAEDLHNAYRPRDFHEMYGQQHVVKALQNIEKEHTKNDVPWPHTYLLVGDAGLGKTTTARILAEKVGSNKANTVEVDAATYTGIDAMRDLMATAHYKGFGAKSAKVFVIDEAHRLSKQAFDSLLKILEEPPAHVYFILCTSEASKVPKTIQSRCITFTFKSIGINDLSEMIEDVADEEGLDLPEGTIGMIARAAQGSARMALTSLAKVAGASTKKEVAELLEQVSEEGEIITLARMICTGQGFTWKDSIALIKKLENENPESIRMVIVNYVQKMIMGVKDERKALPLLSVLSEFSKPFNSSEKMAPVILAVAELLFESESD